MVVKGNVFFYFCNLLIRYIFREQWDGVVSILVDKPQVLIKTIATFFKAFDYTGLCFNVFDLHINIIKIYVVVFLHFIVLKHSNISNTKKVIF